MQFKNILYEAFYRPQRFAANILDTPALILIYHRVNILKSDPQMLAVKPENFYQQVKYLKENYNLVKPEEFSKLINSGKKFPAGTILITFDDGYADNLLQAVPVLKSLSEEALFYISTELLDTDKEIWWDQLEHIFLNNNKLPASLTLTIRNNTYNFDTTTDIKEVYNKIHPLIKFLKHDERKEIIDYLFKWNGIENKGRESYRFLSFDEVRKMSLSGAAALGAHTHTHTPLSVLSYKEQWDEIEKSKNILESLTGNKIEYFSYPFGGRKDYNNNSVKISGEMNFKFVCANYYSQVHKWSNKYALPRVLIRDWDFEYFKKFIRKAFRY